jgi:hypothetical protein
MKRTAPERDTSEEDGDRTTKVQLLLDDDTSAMEEVSGEGTVAAIETVTQAMEGAGPGGQEGRSIEAQEGQG